jgi:preprotein translocase subunit SecE
MADKILTSDQSRKAAKGASSTPFRLYKPGQGTHVRWGTAIGAGIIAVAGANFVYEYLAAIVGDNMWVRTLVPVALLLGAAYLIYWIVGNRRGSVDFLIATEGEMKKVNWSTRQEVFGATKVVIFTVLALSLMLFLVDIFFMLIFSGIGLLKIPIWEQWFGGPGLE